MNDEKQGPHFYSRFARSEVHDPTEEETRDTDPAPPPEEEGTFRASLPYRTVIVKTKYERKP